MRCHVPSCGGPVRCHGMSCFACGRRIACSRSGHGAVVSAWCSGIPSGFPGFRFRHGLSLPSLVAPFSPPPDCPARRDPDSRVMRAGAREPRPRAFRGGAVRAPDCPGAPAREPDAGRTSPVGRIGGLFRAGADARGSGSGCLFPSLFLFYSCDEEPKCKPFGQNFSRFSAMKLIIREKLPVLMSRLAGRGHRRDTAPRAHKAEVGRGDGPVVACPLSERSCHCATLSPTER